MQLSKQMILENLNKVKNQVYHDHQHQPADFQITAEDTDCWVEFSSESIPLGIWWESDKDQLTVVAFIEDLGTRETPPETHEEELKSFVGATEFWKAIEFLFLKTFEDALQSILEGIVE